MSRPVITLTTDFGQADGFVGVMKGVILGICPEASIVDISHDVRPQAVSQAAYVLSAAAPFFPPGTVHVAVVDPGVGSDRRPIVVQTERATYVAPDNGLLSMVLLREPASLAVHLTRPEYRLPVSSATFHGRDVFAPAAAHLASGTDPRVMGPQIPVSDLVTLPLSRPVPQSAGWWEGQVLYVDRFGNLVTNFPSPPPGCPIAVEIAGQRIWRLSRTFADVAPGELLAYVGSSGYVEIAVREGSAAARLGVDVGQPVLVMESPAPPSCHPRDGQEIHLSV